MPTVVSDDALVVLDASAAVALLAEPDDIPPKIAQLMTTSRLVAPSLMHYEACNALRNRVLRGESRRSQMTEDLNVLAALPVDYIDWTLTWRRAMELVDNATAYDASYIALAELTGATLLTRDARLGRAPGLRCEVLVF